MVNDDVLRVPTEDDRNRLDALWRAIAGPGNYSINPQNRMDAWVIEQRMIADRQANKKMMKATWWLVIATVALFCATIDQVVIALAHR